MYTIEELREFIQTELSKKELACGLLNTVQFNFSFTERREW